MRALLILGCLFVACVPAAARDTHPSFRSAQSDPIKTARTGSSASAPPHGVSEQQEHLSNSADAGSCTTSPPPPLGFRSLAVKAGLDALPPATRHVLEAPDSAELLRLDGQDGAPDTGFRRFGIVSRRTFPADGARTLATAVALGIGLGGAEARCFEPGYGVRFIRGARIVDTALCFDCLLIRVFGAGPKGGDLDLPLGAEVLPDLQMLEHAP